MENTIKVGVLVSKATEEERETSDKKRMPPPHANYSSHQLL